jgi:glycosyltransferase involved in cell wall biosynthesis
MLKSLSVVIPVYNELENIPTVLDELLSYIPNIAQMYRSLS